MTKRERFLSPRLVLGFNHLNTHIHVVLYYTIEYKVNARNTNSGLSDMISFHLKPYSTNQLYRKDCQIYQFLYLKAQNAEIKGCQLIKKSIAF